jgi:hypothetical protein
LPSSAYRWLSTIFDADGIPVGRPVYDVCPSPQLTAAEMNAPLARPLTAATGPLNSCPSVALKLTPVTVTNPDVPPPIKPASRWLTVWPSPSRNAAVNPFNWLASLSTVVSTPW